MVIIIIALVCYPFIVIDVEYSLLRTQQVFDNLMEEVAESVLEKISLALFHRILDGRCCSGILFGR